jgi:hypothetical protein
MWGEKGERMRDRKGRSGKDVENRAPADVAVAFGRAHGCRYLEDKHLSPKTKDQAQEQNERTARWDMAQQDDVIVASSGSSKKLGEPSEVF